MVNCKLGLENDCFEKHNLKANTKTLKIELSEFFLYQQNLEKKIETFYDFSYMSTQRPLKTHYFPNPYPLSFPYQTWKAISLNTKTRLTKNRNVAATTRTWSGFPIFPSTGTNPNCRRLISMNMRLLFSWILWFASCSRHILLWSDFLTFCDRFLKGI